MSGPTIHMAGGVLARLRQHLFPRGGSCEEAAFLFARAQSTDAALELHVLEAQLIPPEGFACRSPFYLELTDETRAAVIKRAHDLGAGLIECHSHPGQRGACFSWSDLHGFDEFVPHAMWRLKGKPYAAIVMAPDSFDALVWRSATARVEPAGAIVTETGRIEPTGLTHSNWSEIYDRQPL